MRSPALDTESSSTSRGQLVTRVAFVLFGLLLAILFFRTSSLVVTYPPSFDGSMNLQVASSLADGNGYRRSYAAREAFPHEVQTGPPYILPAAAVFKLFGVGIPQSEVVNVGYLALLLATVYVLVSYLGGSALAMFAGCTVMCIPGLHEYAFYGFGEIPALSLALLATCVYFYAPANIWTGFVSGVVLALAVYTKTVMLIGAGALGLCVLLELCMSRVYKGSTSSSFAGFVVGGASILAVFEAWRLLALGGLRAWLEWWKFEAHAVMMQAGVAEGYKGQTQSLLDKFQVHLHLLSQNYRMSVLLTVIWLVLLILALGFACWRIKSRRRKDWATLTVLFIAAVYLVWWLFETPTAKAWHRRIIDGMIAADVGLLMVLAISLRDQHLELRSWRSLVRVAIAALAVALPTLWLVKNTHTLFETTSSTKACAWKMAPLSRCAKYYPNSDVVALKNMVQSVRDLPKDAYVFGIGWYSAPVVGLLANRHILDFNDEPTILLKRDRPVYFAQTPATPSYILNRIKLLYGAPVAAGGAYALIHVPALVPKRIEAGKAPVESYIELRSDYPYVHGLSDPQGTNGRWLSDDNAALLNRQEGNPFVLDSYVPDLNLYMWNRIPKIWVSFNGCDAAPQRTTPGQMNRLVFVVPSACGISPNGPLNVRIQVDNLVKSSITMQAAALGVVGVSMGFMPSQQMSDDQIAKKSK